MLALSAILLTYFVNLRSKDDINRGRCLSFLSQHNLFSFGEVTFSSCSWIFVSWSVAQPLGRIIFWQSGALCYWKVYN
jgi:hypothetical protein